MQRDADIEVVGLSKAFGALQALDSLNLRIGPGEVFGLLGPNGAGKSTFLRILMGLLIPDAGQALLLGKNSFDDRVGLKRHVGYLPDTPFFYDHLTGLEFLRFMAQIHGLEQGDCQQRVRELLSQLELEEAAHDFVTNYSFGMKKKLGLASALIHAPEILILDEPTAGLDPRATRQLRELMRDYRAGGRLVLWSTHSLDVAEKACDRVGILHHGKLVACGACDELRLAASREGRGDLEEVFLALTQEEARPT